MKNYTKWEGGVGPRDTHPGLLTGNDRLSSLDFSPTETARQGRALYVMARTTVNSFGSLEFVRQTLEWGLVSS